MPHESDDAVQQAAKRILHHYIRHTAHYGEVAEKMAVDYAITLMELEEFERLMKLAASRGYARKEL